MPIKWKKTETILDDGIKISRLHCRGKNYGCVVGKRAHFAKKEGFIPTHVSFSNKKVRYKGVCGGLPFNPKPDTKPKTIELEEGNYCEEPVWIDLEEPEETITKAKVEANYRAEQMAKMSSLRIKLKSKVPKRVLRKFDRLVTYKEWQKAIDLAKCRGVYL